MKLNELRDALNIDDPEQLTKYCGIYTYRVGFFYRLGNDETKVQAKLEASLIRAGISYRIIDNGEQWKSFRGGDTLKQGSHWWVTFEILDNVRVDSNSGS